MGWRPPARDENGGGRRSLWCRGVRRRACSGRSVALSMTWELRYPDLCLEHAEQTLDRQAPLRGDRVSAEEVGECPSFLDALARDPPGGSVRRPARRPESCATSKRPPSAP